MSKREAWDVVHDAVTTVAWLVALDTFEDGTAAAGGCVELPRHHLSVNVLLLVRVISDQVNQLVAVFCGPTCARHVQSKEVVISLIPIIFISNIRFIVISESKVSSKVFINISMVSAFPLPRLKILVRFRNLFYRLQVMILHNTLIQI